MAKQASTHANTRYGYSISHVFSRYTHTQTASHMCPVCVAQTRASCAARTRLIRWITATASGQATSQSPVAVAVTSHNQHRSHSYIRLFAPRGNKQHSIDSRGPCCAPSPSLPPSLSLALPYRVTLLYICHAHNEVEQKCFTAKKKTFGVAIHVSRFLSPFLSSPLPPFSFILLPHRVSKPQSRHPAKRQRGTTRTVSVSILFLPFFQLLLLCCCFCFSFIDSLCVCVCMCAGRTTRQGVSG